MAKIPEYYAVGDRSQMTVEKLLVIIEDAYRDLAIAINKKPDVYQRETNGLTTDTFLNNGDININTLTDNVEILTNHNSTTTVTWTQLS
jgi:hypothetical protein